MPYELSLHASLICGLSLAARRVAAERVVSKHGSPGWALLALSSEEIPPSEAAKGRSVGLKYQGA